MGISNQETEFQEEEDILEEIDDEDGDEAETGLPLEDEGAGALPSSISAFAAQMEEL